MQQLQPGMYVRVPVSEGEDEGIETDFRAFRLARLEVIDQKFGQVAATMFRQPLGRSYAQEALSVRIEFARRCAIFPSSACIHQGTGRSGTVLTAVADEFSCGEYRSYYVLINGNVASYPESELIISGDAQDPDPRRQLLDYEFHEPGWRSLRDPVIQTAAELRNATYGLEELIGSRILILPHQAEVITRALGDTSCRFVLADEVGLGKTIEAAVILKGLRRRNPGLRTLIVTPSSLTHQWANELRSKFWTEFEIVGCGLDPNLKSTGIIVPAEELYSSRLRDVISGSSWDCLIVDEAHHVHKNQELQQFLIQVSEAASSVLVLSATPIERRGAEYLDLLRLMDPARYENLSTETFQFLLDAQNSIRSSIQYIRPTLTPDLYDSDEFLEEFDRLIRLLPHDEYLTRRHTEVQFSGNADLELALDVVAHANTNYRVENRMIRNRRAHVSTELPVREVETRWAYQPTAVELEALEQITEYCESTLSLQSDQLTLEYVRLLLHASASSPHAVLALLYERVSALSRGAPLLASNPAVLLTVRNPREEPDRVTAVIGSAPFTPDESSLLSIVISAVEHWRDETDANLAEINLRNAGSLGAARRIEAAISAVHWLTQNQADGQPGKAIVFSSWPETLDVIATVLRQVYGRRASTQFRAGMTDLQLEEAADVFQSDRSCQILLTDELGGEGRNFQIADGIVHLDLPWSPARIEQRIGRVDRLGRSGTVVSIVPYARATIESELFRIWNEVFELFTRSMSGLEIALEEVQEELVSSLRTSIRHGLEYLRPVLMTRIAEIRDQVERERFYEEGAINQRQRAEFERVREKYRDGTVLEHSTLAWATRAGLRPDVDTTSGIITFSPRNFNEKSMTKAGIMTLPDIGEAIRRMGRRNQQSIRGTFNRDLAILREDLVFYAPSDDPWFEWIVQNAERADRGRCCVVFRRSNKIKRNWKGLELLYRIEVDPRPLYAAGFDPLHLQRVRGFLQYPVHRILISEDGSVMSSASDPARAIQMPFHKGSEAKGDVHQGQRSGSPSPLSRFVSAYPPDAWTELISGLIQIGDQEIRDEFSFLEDIAQEAQVELRAQLRSTNAVQVWQSRHLDSAVEVTVSPREQELVDALVAGLSQPAIRLESACYWLLLATKD